MSIVGNVRRVRDTIAAACERAGRDPAEITLVVVSKTRPPADILQALAAGVQHLGENRVEEAGTKIPAVRGQATAPLTWHMVGHIQSRKARLIPPLFDVVHSVDSLKLARRLSGCCVAEGRKLDILLEVNVSGEESKGGLYAARWPDDEATRAQLWQEAGEIAALPGLHVRGLMTMAPLTDDPETVRPVFANLARLRDALEAALERPLPDLSMGMTDDYPVAIEEGATIVRIGRAIFGEPEK